MSKEIKLVNSKKTSTVDDCCFEYLNSFKWHLLEDGHAARLQQCEEHPDKPHLILMEHEIYDRHKCDIENQSDWDDEDDETCYECHADISEPHSAGCPIAVCLVTGAQRINCEEAHDCLNDAWSGLMPGEAECREFGWWSKWIESPDGNYWTRTTADDPEAVPDFDRLESEARWDRKKQRWVRRGTK